MSLWMQFVNKLDILLQSIFMKKLLLKKLNLLGTANLYLTLTHIEWISSLGTPAQYGLRGLEQSK